MPSNTGVPMWPSPRSVFSRSRNASCPTRHFTGLETPPTCGLLPAAHPSTGTVAWKHDSTSCPVCGATKRTVPRYRATRSRFVQRDPCRLSECGCRPPVRAGRVYAWFSACTRRSRVWFRGILDGTPTPDPASVPPCHCESESGHRPPPIPRGHDLKQAPPSVRCRLEPEPALGHRQ